MLSWEINYDKAEVRIETGNKSVKVMSLQKCDFDLGYFEDTLKDVMNSEDVKTNEDWKGLNTNIFLASYIRYIEYLLEQEQEVRKTLEEDQKTLEETQKRNEEVKQVLQEMLEVQEKQKKLSSALQKALNQEMSETQKKLPRGVVWEHPPITVDVTGRFLFPNDHKIK